MNQVRPEIYKEIKENDLNLVIFQNPFSDGTRKVKRNLLLSSFVCLLIALLKLQITGFLGLQASGQNLGTELAKGLSCILVFYFLLSFIFHTYIDYSAWQFTRERQITSPYLALIEIIENQTNVILETTKSVRGQLSDINLEKDMQAAVHLNKQLETSISQIYGLESRFSDFVEEINPLILNWKNTIKGMDRLSFRLKARFISLWILDIILPIALSILALKQSLSGTVVVWEKIMS